MKTPRSTNPIALSLLLVLAACGAGEAGTSALPTTTPEPVSTTLETTTTTLVETASTVAETTSTTEDAVVQGGELTDWIGSYRWEEFANGDPGSDQTLVHDLTLKPGDGVTLVGTLSEMGFQTDRSLEVYAEPADEYLAVFAAEASPPYDRDVPLLRFSGDPTAPVTILDHLVTLEIDVDEEGMYFEPAEGGVSLTGFSNDEVNQAGIEAIGCWLTPGEDPDGLPVFFAGNAGAYMIVDGEPVLLTEAEGAEDIGYGAGTAYDSELYSVTFTDLGEAFDTSNESTEREAAIVVTGDTGTVEIGGMLACGV